MAVEAEKEAAESVPGTKRMQLSEKTSSESSRTPAKKSNVLSSFTGYFTYFELFFAAQPSWVDVALIICGTLSAIGAGIPFPLMGVLFGQLIDNFNSATCAAEIESAAMADPFQYESTINDKVIQTAWIGAISLVLIYGHLTCWNIISQRLAQRLRTRYVSALLRQPPAFFDTRGAAGQVSNRLHGDITAVQAGTSEKVGNIITTISFFVTVFIIAFSQQPRLAGILVCMLPAFLISGIVGGKYLGKYVAHQIAETSSASSIASEALTHISVVQAFGAAPRLEAKFASHMAKAKTFATTKAAIAAVQTGLLYFIAYSGNALAFWQGSIRIADSAEKQDGSASVGQIYAIVYLLVDACVMLGGIAPTLPFLGAAVAAYERLQEDILAPSTIDGTSNEGIVLPPSTAKSFAFRNVSFEFPSRAGQPVLHQIDLEFPAGKYTAIVGLSGSGKSTIAALMARLHDPTQGHVELDGHDLRNLNVRSLRSFISFVQQEPSLLDRCILENIALGLVNSSKPAHQHLKPFLSGSALAGLADKGIDALSAAASLGPELAEIAELVRNAAEQADAASFIERLESGYGTSAGPNGSRLSGGQRQRIALARALIRDPEILVLDEATASLDSASEKRIQLAVEACAAEQRTIISIAHRLSTIRNADNIIVMHAGRVIEQGTYTDLMAQEQSEFAKMAKLQTLGTTGRADAGSISGDSIYASTLRGKPSVGTTQPKRLDNRQAEKKTAKVDRKEEVNDPELDIVKPFSSVVRGIAWLVRPSLGWCTIAIIAAVFVGATFTGAGVIFGFTVSALNQCENTIEKIRSLGRLFAGLYFMLAGVELFANFLAWFGFGTIAERLLYNLRVLSFRSLLEQTLHWHQSEGRDPTSLLGVITKDSVAVGAFSGSTFGTIFAVCMNVVISIIVSHIFAWKIALVCLVTVPILLGAGLMQLRMLARYEERHRAAFSTATSLATEAIQSIKTVAVLSLEQEYMYSFASLLLPPKKQVVRASVVTNIFLAISYTAGIFVNALAYWWGSQLIMKGQYTQTDFLIILVAMLTSAQLWSSMFSLAPEFSRARLALSRVMTIVNLGSSTHTGRGDGRDPAKTGDDIESSIMAISPAINKNRGGSGVAFKNVSFAYPTRPDVTILDNVSFTLPPNQFCGLVGPSGAGKSTIMNLVQRLYSPTEGAVFIDGEDISQLHTAFRETMAIVPQEPALFDGTIRFNVGLGAPPDHDATDAEIEEACRLANIHDVIIALPDGYDTECGASALSRLSGGQRQRLAIARALIRRPRLLLLDESTSALDAASEEALQRGLEEAVRGTTVLAITHRLHTVQRADVIFVVEDGQIVDSGNHAELMERRESYRINAMSQMLQSQSISEAAGMEDLIKAINTTPIIDNHAHPLLIPSALSKYPLLAITTEAHGDALRTTTSTLSHIRAVKQLSDVLGCPPTWSDVLKAIEAENSKPHHAWQKRCLEGIETILVDDGLDGKDEVYGYDWHDKLTRSECKKIVRIEKVAEEIINELFKNPELAPEDVFGGVREAFEMVIKDAIADPEVVGFKSVVCYRTGLAIPPHMSMDVIEDTFVDHITQLREDGVTHFTRIDNLPMNFYLVNKTAQLIAKSPGPYKKPFQLHTGLGDNDITLTTSSPSHLQPFIRKFPTVPIVLLHASYPWTKEAGYLASVYDNVYADIGEVFPFLSKEGQEKAVREILELCPTEKIMWSTDGHWFPETYLLAIIQVREALEVVLSEYVRDKALTVPQAIRAVQDILFTTSNDLYGLGLKLTPLPSLAPPPTASAVSLPLRKLTPPSSDLHILNSFLEANPSVKFLRLQWLDYTSILRLRVMPVKRALEMLKSNPHLQICITKAALGLIQNDTLVSGLTPTGEYNLQAITSTLKLGPFNGYASMQGEFVEKNGSPVALCPRSLLLRTLEISKSLGLEFLVGFEIEIVFMSRSHADGTLSTLYNTAGHSWSASRAMQGSKIMDVLEVIYDTLSEAGIFLEQFHPESSSGQYEFVLPALPAMEAVDTLIHAREIINTVVANHGMRATMHPKPFPYMAGTASHMHISISSPDGNSEDVYEPFYAGILKHLPAIIALTYSNPASYERMADGCWAGGRWVAWGTQNRETALRKVEDSHFEFKVLDGLANIYFATAAIIAAGTNGVKEKEKMVLGDCLKDPALLSDEEREELGVTTGLPKDLPTALEVLENDDVLKGLLGETFVERYVAIKRGELELFAGMEEAQLKTWTIERY
ncbi:hypothetical protein BKA65DRAFT_554796 [Rhexocercosporidium sp. MPI-PUGE-AT-0058]|nr:hypothetical protein BKA65DRAFT_554796 [Rhexocercosporidium sp. MPI-PUGE-AT-0058]